MGNGMKRLDKQTSRKRSAELRALWNEYDPIGVMGGPHAPPDEYDSFVGPTLRLLARNADLEEIVSYLESVNDHIGLVFDQDRAALFAARAKHWFQRYWSGTLL